MAHVPGFEYDIFISYTHNDNALGWVEQFHDRLEKWLAKIRRLSNLKIWRDKELRGNTEFNRAIQNKIKSSALFLALNSRNYRESDYCRKEVAWFHQYNSDRPGGLFVGEQLRVFNILLNNIPHQQWPEALGKTSGFPIYDAPDPNSLGDFLSPNDERFDNALRKIVDAIELTLQEFVRLAEIAPPTNGANRKVQIFVADVADTLQMQRERLISDIHERGVVVLPDIPPPMESASHETQIQQALTQANLSIHLLDQWPGPAHR
jgi:TIR domain